MSVEKSIYQLSRMDVCWKSNIVLLYDLSQSECLYICFPSYLVFLLFSTLPNLGDSDIYKLCFPSYLYYSYIRWGSLSGKDEMVDIYRLTIRLLCLTLPCSLPYPSLLLDIHWLTIGLLLSYTPLLYILPYYWIYIVSQSDYFCLALLCSISFLTTTGYISTRNRLAFVLHSPYLSLSPHKTIYNLG